MQTWSNCKLRKLTKSYIVNKKYYVFLCLYHLRLCFQRITLCLQRSIKAYRDISIDFNVRKRN